MSVTMDIGSSVIGTAVASTSLVTAAGVKIVDAASG